MTLVVRLIRNKLFAVKNCGVIPFWPFMLLENYSTFQLFSISNLAPYCNTLQLSYLYCLLYNKVFRMAILSFKMPLSQHLYQPILLTEHSSMPKDRHQYRKWFTLYTICELPNLLGNINCIFSLIFSQMFINFMLKSTRKTKVLLLKLSIFSFASKISITWKY